MLVYGSYIQVPNLGVTLFDSYSYDGVSAGIWVIHTGPKSGGELLTLFDSNSYDGLSAGIWVIHRGAKSWCKQVALFGGYSYDGVSAGIWVLHTEVPNLGARWSRFLTVTLMMV